MPTENKPPSAAGSGEWRDISELKRSDDLFWFRRGEYLDGPRSPYMAEDPDYYTHFAPCNPPSMSAPVPTLTDTEREALDVESDVRSAIAEDWSIIPLSPQAVLTLCTALRRITGERK